MSFRDYQAITEQSAVQLGESRLEAWLEKDRFDMGILSCAIYRAAERGRRRLERSAADPAGTQLKVLRSLIQRSAHTQWGRRYRYSELRNVEEFRRRLPLLDYEQAAPDWQRAFAGDRNVTWPGHVKFFAISSGTTSGNKFIPVTRDAIRSNQRAGSYLFALLLRRGDARFLEAGKFLHLTGSTTLRQRGHCLYGDASAILARHIPWLVRSRYLPDRRTAALVDWEAKIRSLITCCLTADVRAVSACPSWAALLFRDLQGEASRRLGRETSVAAVWPNLRFFISFGMAPDPYRTAFDAYVGHPLRFVDTYSSSEAGLTAIQEGDREPLRLIIDNGVFFEFVPADRVHDESPPRLHLGEVEEGKPYALVLNTNGGIWGYLLGDVIRFESVRPPRIVFCGRTSMSLNAFGEHVTLEMIETAVAAACQATAARVADYTVSPRFPCPDQPRPAHRWVVEFDKAPDSEARFLNTLDASIRRQSEDYDTHRVHDYGLGPPVLLQVAPRTFYAWMKQRGQLGGQHKVPRVAPSPDTVEELVAVSATREHPTDPSPGFAEQDR